MCACWGYLATCPTGQMAVDGRLLLITSRLIEEKHVLLTHNHTHTYTHTKPERKRKRRALTVQQPMPPSCSWSPLFCSVSSSFSGRGLGAERNFAALSDPLLLKWLGPVENGVGNGVDPYMLCKSWVRSVRVAPGSRKMGRVWRLSGAGPGLLWFSKTMS